MASELAGLNRAIGDAVFRGQQPNDLMDRRDQLIDRLSQLAQVSVTDTGNSRCRIDFGGVDARRPEHADRLHLAADAQQNAGRQARRAARPREPRPAPR